MLTTTFLTPPFSPVTFQNSCGFTHILYLSPWSIYTFTYIAMQIYLNFLSYAYGRHTNIKPLNNQTQKALSPPNAQPCFGRLGGPSCPGDALRFASMYALALHSSSLSCSAVSRSGWPGGRSPPAFHMAVSWGSWSGGRVSSVWTLTPSSSFAARLW